MNSLNTYCNELLTIFWNLEPGRKDVPSNMVAHFVSQELFIADEALRMLVFGPCSHRCSPGCISEEVGLCYSVRFALEGRARLAP